MERSRVLAVGIIALMVLATLPAQGVAAQSPYSEKLNVYVSGSSALWYFTFSGINGSTKLSTFESTPGLSWYNISAISTVGWKSDFQAFGPAGYNLIPVPFIPSQGLYLTLGSDSYADASAAASALGPYLLTSFTSLSNGTGTYSFYSPLSFTKIIPTTLFRFVPSGAGGFAAALQSSQFDSTNSPFIVLEGVSSSGGFSHSLVVGSIAPSAFSSGSKLNVLSYFGGSTSTLNASKLASSSVVKVTALDGVISSTDAAVVKNDGSSFRGSYTLSIPQGKRITGVNATVSQGAAPLLASRAIDVGVLRTNGDIAVTLSFSNISPTATITHLSFTDGWWNGTGQFTFLSGNDTVNNISLNPNTRVTPVYRLQYTGTSSGSLTIPASVVRYEYQVGKAEFNATAVMNPIKVSLNADNAVVYAILTPVGSLGKAVGNTQTFNLTLVNVGTLPASSVVAAGKSISGLAGRSGSLPGGSATITLSQAALGLTGTNTTRSYSVTYQNPSGTSFTTTSNVVSNVFSHTGMNIGFPQFSVTGSVAQVKNAVNLTLGFSLSDFGPRNLTSFTATGSLPNGLGCGTVSGHGVSCSNGQVTISYPLVNKSTTERGYISYLLTNSSNFVVAPLRYSVTTAGLTLSGWSGAAAAPAGLTLGKLFSPSKLFEGTVSHVTAAATNGGPLPVYNVTLTSTADPFDVLTTSTTLTRTLATLQQGGSLSMSYDVNMSRVSPDLVSAPASATFTFAGTAFTLRGGAENVSVYQPLSASITTAPKTPEEGKSFMVTVVVNNPTGVSVSDVQFSLPLPSGVTVSNLVNAQVSSQSLTIAAAALAGGSNITATLTMVASSGIVIPFDKSTLSFSYAGATVNGATPSGSGIAVSENVTTRYLIPIAFVLIAMLGVAYYLRREATVPSSPK